MHLWITTKHSLEGWGNVLQDSSITLIFGNWILNIDSSMLEAEGDLVQRQK